MMKALYDNRLYLIVESEPDLLLQAHDGNQIFVECGDDGLIIDPTDAEVAGASNLADWYRLNDKDVSQLRSVLRGEAPLSSWCR